MGRREVIAVLESKKVSIFPTADNIGEAVQRINMSLHEIPRARITPLINLYHNTLLNQLKKTIEELPND